MAAGLALHGALPASAAIGRPDPANLGIHTLDIAPSPRHRPRPAPLQTGRLPMVAGDVESDVVANLLRGLLRIRSAPAAAALLQRTILGLGGLPVPAREASEQALPVDVSLGEGSPMLVEVDRFTVAGVRLERLLPRLVDDARQAVDLLHQN